MRTTGMTIWLAEVMKASRAALASATVKGALLERQPLRRDRLDQRRAGDAAQDAVGRPAG